LSFVILFFSFVALLLKKEKKRKKEKKKKYEIESLSNTRPVIPTPVHISMCGYSKFLLTQYFVESGYLILMVVEMKIHGFLSSG
jgi:hypothetical protein